MTNTQPPFVRWTRGWRLWIFLLVLWMIPALVFAITIHWRQLLLGSESNFMTWFMLNFYGWIIWVPLTLLIVQLAKKVRLQREKLVRTLLFHFVMSIIIVMFQLGYYVWLFGVTESTQPMTLDWWWEQYLLYITIRGPWAWFLYWFVLGVYYSWDYYHQYIDRELKASRLETQLVRSQLGALKDKLHPHFLYNALHSVAMLVRKGDKEASVNMLAGLSDLLRYVLEKGDQQITSLQEEIDFTRKYLDIQQLRFSDRLQTRYSIPDELYVARVPFLILQPLVENALRHGLSPKKEGGFIGIDVQKHDELLELTVTDDGVGLDGADPLNAEGFGMSNVRDRLRHLYGDKGVLTFDQPAAGGLLVKVSLPYSESETIEATEKA